MADFDYSLQLIYIRI